MVSLVRERDLWRTDRRLMVLIQFSKALTVEFGVYHSTGGNRGRFVKH